VEGGQDWRVFAGYTDKNAAGWYRQHFSVEDFQVCPYLHACKNNAWMFMYCGAIFFILVWWDTRCNWMHRHHR